MSTKSIVLFLEEMDVIEEGAGKQLAAFLTGLGGYFTAGHWVGGIQKRNMKIYERLKAKLSGEEFKRSSPSMIAGFLLGYIPLIAAVFNLRNQRQIDKIRAEIVKKIDAPNKRRLEQLEKQLKKRRLTDSEIHELVKLENKLYSKFDKEEMTKLRRIAKSLA